MSVQRVDLGQTLLLWSVSACVSLLAAGPLLAQNTAGERTFHAPKSQVEKALDDLQARAGGRLPILDGFVDQQDLSLDHYQRGYYQYSLEIAALGSEEARVRVKAKITAWYTGDSPSKSGYQVLLSNGRLETDLLDRLEDALKGPAAWSVSERAAPTPKPAEGKSLAAVTDSPDRRRSAAILGTARTQIPPTLPDKAAPQVVDATTEKRIQQLTREADALQQVLENQSRPSNLAVVKLPRTPVVAKPVAGAEVLFLADQEDEFQVVDTLNSWVHVQISGISRGWIHSDQVDIPAATLRTLATSYGSTDTSDKPGFRQKHEEVSLFPGKWEPLTGKKVKVIWVEPSADRKFGRAPKWNLAKSVFRRAYPEVSNLQNEIAGVVVIFDSEDGGMAAATMATLQQWHAGHLPDDAFWKRCWLDPADAFKLQE